LYEQLFVESILLAVLGGVVAVIVGRWAGSAFRSLLFARVHWAASVIDARTGLFIGSCVFGVGLFCGVVPALFAARTDPIEALKGSGLNGTPARSIAASALLAAQAALCVVLITGAGLFVRSLSNVKSIDVGFEPNRILAAALSTTPGHRWGAETVEPMAAAAAAMRLVPGVEGVALSSTAPMGGFGVARQAYLANGDSLNDSRGSFASFAAVSPSYFRTLETRVIAGRDFSDVDGDTAPLVVIVTRYMAATVWPGHNPIGQCLIVDGRGAPCATVIGVVDDTRRMRLMEPPALHYYRPLAQSHATSTPYIVVRVDPRRLTTVLSALRTQVRRQIPEARHVWARTVEQTLEPQMRTWRVGADLFTAFGLLALVVAGVGIYSVVSYAVSQRMREMGIRVALGASAKDILNVVISRGAAAIAVGAVAGVFLSLLLGRYLSSMLFGVTPSDPGVILGAVAALIGATLTASIVPGIRGFRVDPMRTLRAE